MKNVLFVTPAFSIGGTNTSLISLLPFLDRRLYNVYVYALNPTGPMENEIAKFSTILNRRSIGLKTSEKNLIVSKIMTLLKAIKHILGNTQNKVC